MQGKSLLVKKLNSDLQSKHETCPCSWSNIFTIQALWSSLVRWPGIWGTSVIKRRKRLRGKRLFKPNLGHVPPHRCVPLSGRMLITIRHTTTKPWVFVCLYVPIVEVLTTAYLIVQSKSNAELKSMFNQHYKFLVLLSGPLASLQATVPKMTPMDGKHYDIQLLWCYIIWLSVVYLFSSGGRWLWLGEVAGAHGISLK